MPAPDGSLSLPLTVDSFTLTRCIGAGAMGEVYLATEALTGRQVAVKAMATELVGNPRAEARFRREIATMGQLRHPGIPAFAGYGALPGGRPYLAMEFVAGHPLDGFLGGGAPLPEDLALWVALQITDIVGHCNREAGMIHRDLKPSNIMIDLAGHPGLSTAARIVVIDFGLATYIDFGDYDDYSPRERQLVSAGTMVGEIMGTPHYMSPEQIRGERLSFHSDIYAIGAILCHLLTGRTAYQGASSGVVMAAHLDAPVPDPGKLLPLRPTTVAVVQRAMAKQPQARFRSFQQLSASLQAARFAFDQATRRIGRPITATIGAERLSAAPVPVASAPASQPTTGWRRPATTTVSDQPSTSSWRRPKPEAVAPPQDAGSPALDPKQPTTSWMHRAIKALPRPQPDSASDEFPTTPAPSP